MSLDFMMRKRGGKLPLSLFDAGGNSLNCQMEENCRAEKLLNVIQ